MNCFEARQLFAPLWRKSLDPATGAVVIAHLYSCQGCDRAFRGFSLTAPALYSHPPKETVAALDSGARTSKAVPIKAATVHAQRSVRRHWLPVGVAASLAFALGLATYAALAAPSQTLDEVLLSGADTPSEVSSSLDYIPTT